MLRLNLACPGRGNIDDQPVATPWTKVEEQARRTVGATADDTGLEQHPADRIPAIQRDELKLRVGPSGDPSAIRGGEIGERCEAVRGIFLTP